MMGAVCSYCGSVSNSPMFDKFGRRYCCTQHRILGESEPFSAPPPARRRDDDDDIAAMPSMPDFTPQEFGVPDSSFTGGGGESAGGGASGDY